MKNLILSLLLVPFLVCCQGPSFTLTDNNGVIWDSETWLNLGVTIVVQFFTPSMTCWPSSNSIENISSAYEQYGNCNDILFLQVAQWGGEFTTSNFMEEFSNPEIPYIVGYPEGQSLTIEWMELGLQWAYECWVLYPNGEYLIDLDYQWDLEQTVLIDLLEENGFKDCNEHNLELEDYKIENNNEIIYDLQGRTVNKKPTNSFYLESGKIKYLIK
tara:strand:+ start:144 stop:788 length:645 start_codon:yes stop_codon:yes gene_type:complete